MSLAAIVAACGFPDPDLDGAVTGGEGGATSPNDVTSSTNDASADAAADAPPPLVCDDADCDCDKDNQKKAGVCGGQDCYDRDPDAKEGQTIFITKKPPADFDGDWDCDKTVTKQYAGNTGACTTGLTKEICESIKGFIGQAPGCGAQAEFRACNWTGSSCVESKRMEFQGCK